MPPLSKSALNQEHFLCFTVKKNPKLSSRSPHTQRWRSDCAHHLKYWSSSWKLFGERVKNYWERPHVPCLAKQTPAVGHTGCTPACQALFHSSLINFALLKYFMFAVWLETFNIAAEQFNCMKLVLSWGAAFCSILLLLTFSGYLYTRYFEVTARTF